MSIEQIIFSCVNGRTDWTTANNIRHRVWETLTGHLHGLVSEFTLESNKKALPSFRRFAKTITNRFIIWDLGMISLDLNALSWSEVQSKTFALQKT